MQLVTVSRTIPADPETVRDLVTDLEPFMRAGGFSEVTVENDEIYLRQNIGLGRIELDLRVVPDADVALAYQQVDGIFNQMRTEYDLESVPEGTRVTARTEFEIGGVFGSVLDATIVKRKRRSELNAQFDYLEDAVSSD
ncbi:MAG: SRPBCC family protein [Halobacteriales archaeon]